MVPRCPRSFIRLSKRLDAGQGLGPGWRTGERMGLRSNKHALKLTIAVGERPRCPRAVIRLGERVGPSRSPVRSLNPGAATGAGTQEMMMVNQARAKPASAVGERARCPRALVWFGNHV